MSWLITNLITELVLPPMSLLVLGGLGLLLLKRQPVTSKALIAITFIMFYGFSTPFFAEATLKILEPETALQALDPKAGAIVVLGGGTYFNPPEYPGDTVSPLTLERLRYGARLQRSTGNPVLVTGGKPLGNPVSEARQMQRVLSEDFGVPVKWLEEASDNTYENASKSRAILREVGVDTIYLVTHAWHMPRARMVFERAGFRVIPAPTGFTTRFRTDVLSFIPSADGLQASRWFLREVMGILWYRLRLEFDADRR